MGKISNRFRPPYFTGDTGGGGGGGAVTSVNGAIGAVTVNLDSILAETTSLTDGVFAISVIGGVATAVPIASETVGSYKSFAHTDIPANYLWANGSIELIATYPSLFAKIGNRYGGDGITTFGIPDYRGRFIKGDSGSDIATSAGLNTLTTLQLPSHSHSIVASNSIGDTGDPSGAYLANGGADSYTLDGSSLSALNSNTIQNIGSNQPHEHPHLVGRIAICFESVGISGASPTPSFNAVLGVSNNSNIRAELNGVGYATVNDVFISPYVIVNANYTTLATDRFIETQTSGITITLLTAVGNTGRIFEVINSSAGNVMVTLVEGASFTLFTNETLKVISNGTIYKIIA